tara:strand:- start:1396 stop:1683 length:288 start_codon:yes stop_codon:yes gene_type:complete
MPPKKLETLKCDLAHHEQLAAHWSWLAKRDCGLPTRFQRIGNANYHAKQALDIQAEINGWDTWNVTKHNAHHHDTMEKEKISEELPPPPPVIILP